MNTNSFPRKPRGERNARQRGGPDEQCEGEKGRSLMETVERAKVIAAARAVDNNQHREAEKRRAKIGGEVIGYNLRRRQIAAASGTGKREHEKSGVRDGRVSEQTLEIRLRDGGQIP